MPDELNRREREGEKKFEGAGGAPERRPEQENEEQIGEEQPEEERQEQASREALEKAQEKAGSVGSSQAQSDSDDKGDIEKKDSFAELQKLESAEDKIEKLTQIAGQEGPETAIKMARKLNENYVMDMLHDEMVDEGKLREELVKKGFIEEE
ncbi:MAG: hypothetical protein U5L10_00900 [Candidatus Moranbacteria bacterium]|nr:hypothetical protein [Candidatus Moranbacteria bacterium]